MASSNSKLPNVFEVYAEMLRSGGAVATAAKAQQKMGERSLSAVQMMCEAMAVYTSAQQDAVGKMQSAWLAALQKASTGTPQVALERMNAAAMQMMTQNLSEQSAAAESLAQSLSKAHALMAAASQEALKTAQQEGQKVSSEWAATAQETVKTAAKTAAAQVEQAHKSNPFKGAVQLPDIWNIGPNTWWNAEEWLSPAEEKAQPSKAGKANVCPPEGCEANAKPTGSVTVGVGKVTALN